MLKIYDCLTASHDLRLVLLASAVCVMVSYAAFGLLRHARGSKGTMRPFWMTVTAVAIGFGIWATHFIAMIAFAPGAPGGYDAAIALLSLVVAVAMTGIGISLAVAPTGRRGSFVGGVVIALGIACMHYLGMASYRVAGVMHWDPVLMSASVVVVLLLGTLALPVGLAGRSDQQGWKAAGAAMLSLAICAHHFTGMAAVSILPDPRVPVAASVLPSVWLAGLIGAVAIFIVSAAVAGVAVETRDRRRNQMHADHMRGLANAAVEGLLIVDDDRVATVNDSFAALAGGGYADLVGSELAGFFPESMPLLLIRTRINTPVETVLRPLSGPDIPVEVISRPLDINGRSHRVLAVRDLRARHAAEQHIRYLALHDPLTGLPNRSHFTERADAAFWSAIRGGDKVAVLCIDLDRFKEINDCNGHAEGDRVLREVATRSLPVLGEKGTMARFGGDEFAVIASGVADRDAAAALAERLRRALAGDGSDPISCSIGVAVFPDDGEDRETVLRNADIALYRAKEDGRGCWRIYEETMGESARERRAVESDLRMAIVNREFELVFQPQCRIGDGRVRGFETLLRWRHPVRGYVPPDVFVPIAEEAGSIAEIGAWVLRESCREAAGWSDGITVAVNVSAVQLYDVNFARDLHQILIDTGLPPARLEIEITETALIRDPQRALGALRRVKAFGVRIAMDDFGTGYSSLSNLTAFPFDKLKIDKSFVRGVDANAQAATIVRAVLGIGRGLGLPVTAEGVETEQELEFLRKEGCEEVQGYLFGRPAPIAAFRNVVDAPVAKQAERVRAA